MKNHFITLSLILLLSTAASAQFKLGIIGGADYTKLNIHRSTASDYSITGKAGYRVGLASELTLNSKVSLAADLLFSRKGFEQSAMQEATGNDHLVHQISDVDVSLNYLELPVIPEFKVEFKKMNVRFGVGPYIAYGFGGKFEANIHTGSATTHFSDDIHWSKAAMSYNLELNQSIVENLNETNIKRLDYGPVVRFGVEIKSFSINAEYQYGVPNLMYEWRKYESVHTQRLGLSVKYMLWAKKQ